MSEEMNYKIISLKVNSKASLLYCFEDLCLYKKNGLTFKTKEQNFKCIGENDATKEKCNVTGKVTVENKFVRINPEMKAHNHDNHETQARQKEFVHEIKTQGLSTADSLEVVMNRKLQDEKSPVLKILNHKRILSTARKVRQRRIPRVKSAADLDLLMRSNEYFKNNFSYFREMPFYRGVVSANGSYANIFVTEQLVQQPENITNILIDGTFKVVPLMYTQLLILFAEISNNIYPVCFVLMTRKTFILYKAVFNFLKETFNLNPEKFTSDFESAMRKAIRSVWPAAIVNGCWFHYCQALRRRKGSLFHLAKLIRKNDKADAAFKMFLKIPLLPRDRMKAGLNSILRYQKRYFVFKRFNKFNSYYVKNWITRFSYNIHGEKYRTNNYAEAYNAKIKRIIPRNPSVFCFLSKLHLLVGEVYAKYHRNIEVATVPKSVSKYTERIEASLLKLSLDEYDEELFLLSLI